MHVPAFAADLIMKYKQSTLKLFALYYVGIWLIF